MADDAGAVRAAHLTVTVGRDDVPVLDDVSVVVPAGTGLLVVGPSGCGKSTLLRVLTGVVPQTLPGTVTGVLDVAGHDPREVPVARLAARVGMLQQNPGDQLCLARVDDELRFALENRGADPATMDARVTGALDAVGAAHLADRATHALSGGEAQRVALAAALVADPEVVVLDEPTALLDPAAAREVGALVTGLTRPQPEAPSGTPLDTAPGTVPGTPRRTVVVVEHRLDELGRLPDATLVLDRHGRAVAHGPTPDLLRRRARDLVALGCRLPLDVHLEAAGAPGPLGTPRTDAWLVDLARAHDVAPGGPPPDGHVARGPVVLGARDLVVLRAGAPVVRAARLDLHAGEVLAVVGPNGSGKSTLLRGLAGLEPTTGELSTAAHVAMVFQDPEHQLLARTVRDEVAWSARLARLPGLDARVQRTLETFGLAALADANPFRLSGGEQRRLSLATATVLDPAVLLADEPTFGLDRTQGAATARVLRGRADGGGAVGLVTHDLSLVAQIADRVAVVVDGEVVAVDEPAVVLADAALRARAALTLPPLLEWWATTGRGHGVDPRALVRALDAALHAPDHGTPDGAPGRAARITTAAGS